MELSYPLFDGEKVIDNACVVVEDGRVTAIREGVAPCGDGMLLPGLLDAHTHLDNTTQVSCMLRNGIAAACDVSAPAALVETAEPFGIVSSAGMTMGTLDGRGYVKKALAGGARYIKILLTEPVLLPRGILTDICEAAHEAGLKAVVHAVSVKAVRLAVDCGADILLHVPIRETLPEKLAEEIAAKEIAVAPTLVMMEAFANSGRRGYEPTDYFHAVTAVQRLHACGVRLLVGTDANSGSYAPAVPYGISLHREMELLARAGIPREEILAGASSGIAEAFGLTGIGRVAVGEQAVLLLVDGRPDRQITDTAKIRQLWIGGRPVL